MSGMARMCPKCETFRGLNEFVCEALNTDGSKCGYSLLNVRPTAPSRPKNNSPGAEPSDGTDAAVPVPLPAPDPRRFCPNGHVNELDDKLCMTCGEAIALPPNSDSLLLPEERNIGGWVLLEALELRHDDADTYRAKSEETGTIGVLRHFAHGVEPRTRLYPVLQRLSSKYLARLIDFGREAEHGYEVWDQATTPTLSDLTKTGGLREGDVLTFLAGLAAALETLESNNLRHGDLTPSAIRFRGGGPETLELGDLSTASLAEFGLEASQAARLTRYVSPEAIVGSSSQASDWWSLGVILLELLTEGRFFNDVNDRAFLLQVIARGIDLPPELSPEWTLLLRGLLTRDHARRWRGEEVRRWLSGDREIPIHFETHESTAANGPRISLAGRPLRDAKSFALSAATRENWDEALGLTEIGTVGTWLNEIGEERDVVQLFKEIMDDRRIDRDTRFALALMALNPHLPIVLRGDIKTPNRLLEDPDAAAIWFERPVVSVLRRLKREAWLLRLAERASRVEARAAELHLTLVPERFRVARLAAFETRLEAFWRERRRLFPDAAIPGIATLMDRRSLTDEDLILLICADDLAFRSGKDVLDQAAALAAQMGVANFDGEEARAAFDFTKRQLVDDLSDRLGAFKRYGQDDLDSWADALRLGRRLSLAQILVLRATDRTKWREPPHQDYLRNVLQFLQKKIIMGVQRGPLIKLMIGRSASRIDLLDIGDRGVASTLLDRALKRDDQPISLAFGDGRYDERQTKLKGIAKASDLHRRETGVSALVLAYPLVGFEDRTLTGAASIRIAPIVLWPVRISVNRGQTTVAFDGERDPELNPALDRVLGEEAAERWRAALEPALRGDAQSVNDLFSALSALAKCPEHTELKRVPEQSSLKGKSRPNIVSAGAIMLADFPSQAIVEDLRNILSKPISGSALECLLRLGEATTSEVQARPHESERYSTLDADPSQEEAVLAARQVPGLKLEGPPGTGKSQTIVNVITDCLGRNETVVLVCEKQAALEVVHKRLRAEGLGHRVVRIENTQTDRKRLLEELQIQIPEALRTPRDRVSEVWTRRAEAAAAIDHLEADLSAYHEAVYAPSTSIGLSYRHLVARIAALEDDAQGLSVPDLRGMFAPLRPVDIERIVGECAGLVEVWFDADFSDQSLEMFSTFASDAALEQKLRRTIEELDALDSARRAAIAEASPVSNIAAIATAESVSVWWSGCGERLKTLSIKARKRIVQWRRLLDTEPSVASSGNEKREALKRAIENLRELAPTPDERTAYNVVAKLDRDILMLMRDCKSLFSARRSIFDALNVSAHFSRSRVKRVLKALGLPNKRPDAEVACSTAAKELGLRIARTEFEGLAREFELHENASQLSADQVRERATKLLAAIDQALAAVDDIKSCPWPQPLWDGLPSTQSAWEAAFGRIEAIGRLLDLSGRAAAKLADLKSWATVDWLEARHQELATHLPFGCDLRAVLGSLSRLGAFQSFRQSRIDREAAAVFAGLNAQRHHFLPLSAEQRAKAIEDLIRREAAFAWSDILRRERPILASPPQKISGEVVRLAKADADIRELNKKYLGLVDPEGIASTAAWSQVWQIGGIRAQRLRQVFDAGRDMGLLKARPIWLVNPDVASRIFPLEPGLFDVAIFDEASQMRVENAVPALYRARRAIVSGDSKQLPPTTFFGSTVSDDDDDTLIEEMVGEDADAESAERRKQEEAINRRHVKDCQDLLALSQGALPERSLNIHYRSAYRELIAFSNAAYYAGQLNVPVNHPPSEVKRHKPIEVRRIDGVYRNQSNAAEARAVVDYLSDLWRTAGDRRPTVGVVTFNLKQTELIEEELQRRASDDRSFRVSLEQELGRKADGEDVSFFVRNLENVQGDERDYILFSTTFGESPSGDFSKNFGALSKSGGERRLNVAITRAKSKVVVMTSMPTNKISPDFAAGARGPTKARDYLQAYLRYAENVTLGELDAAKDQLSIFDSGAIPLARVEDDDTAADALIERVRSVLAQSGFETVLRPLEGAFAVDLAVIHPETGLYCLGVELDGPRHHVLNSAKARDIWRPRLLERQGMRLHRVLSAAWATDPARERERLIGAALASAGRSYA